MLFIAPNSSKYLKQNVLSPIRSSRSLNNVAAIYTFGNAIATCFILQPHRPHKNDVAPPVALSRNLHLTVTKLYKRADNDENKIMHSMRPKQMQMHRIYSQAELFAKFIDYRACLTFHRWMVVWLGHHRITINIIFGFVEIV